MLTNHRYLYFTVFCAGMTTLAIEFVTSRMLQTVYGTSNIVWANVIGFVLLFLTAGYFIGGRLADHYPNERTFYLLICLAGFSSILFLLLTSLLLKTSAAALAELNVGVILSSLAGVILALIVPITLLGCVSPFAIRLAVTHVEQAGRTSGFIYALSTWGSLLGTYLPVLWIIPTAGSRLAAVIFGSVLLLVGLVGLWRAEKKWAMGMLLLTVGGMPALSLTTGPLKTYPGQLYETESAYNYIQVIRQDNCNYLLLNEGQAYHSFYCDGGEIPRLSVWSIMLAAPFFNAQAQIPKRIAVIGLAAGTIPKQFTDVFGAIPIDGIELDPQIVEVGQRYFDLTDPNIHIIIGDGRYELNRLTTNYDLITLDAYKVPYIPWHLTTQQFFSEVRAHLTPEGVLAINVGRVPSDRRLVEAITATLLTVFPTVHTIDISDSLNTILIATVQETSATNVPAHLAQLPLSTHPLLTTVLETATQQIVPTIASTTIFTDERAPVETIIDSLVIRYLLQQGPAGLPGLDG